MTPPAPSDAPATRGATPAGAAKIVLEDLHKSFGTKVVLAGVDLSVAAGESLVIVGGSGTGKSVTLKHVIGLIRPDSGRVTVDGVDLTTLSEREITRFRRRYGMSFQEGALFDSMTVRQNVGFPLQRVTRKSPAEIRDRVDECLELVHLEGTGDKMPAELSGGMRRRVGFARAIALEPEILLFDEPTTGLDPVLTAVLRDVLLELQETLQPTTLTITHDLDVAFSIADRVAMLYRGRIIAAAPPEEFRRLDDPRVQQFVSGSSQGPMTDDEP